MKRHIMYISEKDNQTFADRFECAHHELVNQPELLQKLHDATKDRDYATVSNWCGGDPEERSCASACACMGCANGAFYELGLEYAHWKVWLEILRKPQTGDGIDRYMDVDVLLESIGPRYIDVYKRVREATGLNVLETKNLLAQPNVRLLHGVDQYYSQKLVNDLEKLGATVKVVESKKQRRVVMEPIDFGFFKDKS